jgi:signal transduction histidine kinase
VTEGTSEQGRGVVERITRASPTTLRGRSLILAQVAWVAVAVLTVGVFVTGIPGEFARLQAPCTGGLSCVWVPRLTAHKVQQLGEIGLSTDLFAAYFVAVEVAFMAVPFALGAAIFWRRSDDRMALLGSLMLITFGATLTIPYPLLDLPLLWKFSAEVVSFIGTALLILFIYVFPDGRFVPPWTRWLAATWIGLMVPVHFFAEPLNALLGNPWVNGLFATGLVGTMLIAQVYRYRWVSGPSQRQQTKWVVFGIVAALGGSCVLLLLSHIVQGGLLSSLVGNTVWFLLMLLIPLSIAVAVLRYHLYDIDLLINRTLVYGALSIIVVGLYVLVVGSLGALLQLQGSLFASLIATGLVAVMFAPLRERLQSAVNRLMYGQRDDPYKVLSGLGERLETTLAPNAVLPTIVESVAQALKLPYAAITLKRNAEDESVKVAQYGKKSAGEPLIVALSYQQETVGELILSRRSPGESFSNPDLKLLGDLAHQVGVAAHAVRLSADLQRSRERLVTAREEERKRLRRDLHDGVGPQLAALILKLETARNLLSHDPKTAALLGELSEGARATVSDVRRSVHALRPPALDELGLVPALREGAAQYSHNGLNISLEAPESLPPLPAAVEVATYHIAQEAMTNVVRHAGASNCSIRIALDEEAGVLHLEVEDDGRGVAEDHKAGVGTHSMRERAEELGGRCTIEALPQRGTLVSVELPCWTAQEDTHRQEE